MKSVKCPKCGFVLLANSPSCKSCGAPLPSTRAATMSDRPERRAQKRMDAYHVGSVDRDDNQQNQFGT